jgi:uncharacterized SAM-dependent methyltransferase
MRCPDCNKFVSFNTETEPEVELDLESGSITGTVRIYHACEECGTELREMTFDVDVDVSEELKDHLEEDGSEKEGHELTFETDESLTQNTVGKGRSAKTFYGAEVRYTIKCSCSAHDTPLVEDVWQDDTEASNMDECC